MTYDVWHPNSRGGWTYERHHTYNRRWRARLAAWWYDMGLPRDSYFRGAIVCRGDRPIVSTFIVQKNGLGLGAYPSLDRAQQSVSEKGEWVNVTTWNGPEEWVPGQGDWPEGHFRIVKTLTNAGA